MQKLLVEVPLHTPSRANFIATEIREYMEKFTQDYNYVLLDLNLPDGESRFYPNDTHIHFLMNTLSPLCINNTFDSVKKILIPSDLYCCGRRLRVDSRPANIRLYGLYQMVSCWYYHSKRTDCKTVYYYNYSE